MQPTYDVKRVINGLLDHMVDAHIDWDPRKIEEVSKSMYTTISKYNRERGIS